jgi:mannose-6-phosphate isomerase-like protein (cupin superfamily)
VEEVYIVIDGNGRITADDVTVDVHPGDAILNRLGGSHGIYNNSNDELELLVVSVCMEKGKLDAIDLGDDLSNRK